MIRGAIYFQTHRRCAARQDTAGRRLRKTYKGEVDYFGVYCLETEKVYLVPIEAVGDVLVGSLRVTPAKNNQQKRIRWAEDFAVRPLPIEPPRGTILL